MGECSSQWCLKSIPSWLNCRLGSSHWMPHQQSSFGHVFQLHHVATRGRRHGSLVQRSRNILNRRVRQRRRLLQMRRRNWNEAANTQAGRRRYRWDAETLLGNASEAERDRVPSQLSRFPSGPSRGRFPTTKTAVRYANVEVRFAKDAQRRIRRYGHADS